MDIPLFDIIISKIDTWLFPVFNIMNNATIKVCAYDFVKKYVFISLR